MRANDDASLRDRGKPFFSPDGRFRAAPFFPMKDDLQLTANDMLISLGECL